jgi:hypothetical protein
VATTGAEAEGVSGDTIESATAADAPTASGAGPKEPLAAHHQELTERARVRHDALTDAIEAIERALAEASVQRERAWSERAARALEHVRAAIRDHAEGVEERDGLFDEIGAVQPRLSRRVYGLRREHRSLSARAGKLSDGLTSAAQPDVGALRREASALLADLRAHRATEADLIFEAFWIEIGVGD